MKQVLGALVRQEAKSPIVWVALTFALVAWPVSLNFSPLSSALSSGSARTLAYDVAFLFALAGALLSDRRLASKSWLWTRASGGASDVLFVLWVGLGAALPTAFSLAPMALFQGVGAFPALGVAFLACLHMAALLLLLARLGFSLPERSVGFIILALALPAALPTGADPPSLPWRILDPLSGGGLGDANTVLTIHQIGSIFILVVIARTLGFRSAR